VNKETEVVDSLLRRAANGRFEVLEKMLHVSCGDLLTVANLLYLTGANGLTSSGPLLSGLTLHLLPRSNLKGTVPGRQ